MPKQFLALVLIGALFTGCTQNNVKEDNSLKKYFDQAGARGSFGLFDNGQGNFTIYNLPRYRDSAFQPAQTFEIVLSLTGIQTGAVGDENAILPLPVTTGGELHGPAQSGCQDSLTLKKAFQQSCENGFQGLASRIGKDTLKKWIDSLSYGNRNTGGPIDSFWYNNHLKITSDEQLGLVKKLYFDQLPYYQRPQKIIRGMMLAESNANYQLSYKTGLGYQENGKPVQWMLGWIEENKHPYFFVLNLESTGPQALSNSDELGLLKSILKQLEFFQGKK